MEQTKDQQTLLNEALRYGKSYVRYGKPASYIPELAKIDPNRLGVALCELDGTMYTAGEVDTYFTMQSISKVMSLILAIKQNGFEYVFTKVGMEPTGDAFNSMVRLDQLTDNKPFNPMINAGAIAVASCIRGSSLAERQQACVEFARKLTGNPNVDIDFSVFASEKATGYRNRAMINLMKSNGIIDGEPEEHLDLYFSICSISCTCRDLAYFGAVLANNGIDPRSGEELIPLRVVKLVRSFMVTCGMYDYSGEFAATVGMPSKSGVGGGIVSAPIGKCGIGVYGPALDVKGNSVGGLKMLEYLANEMNLHMF